MAEQESRRDSQDQEGNTLVVYKDGDCVGGHSCECDALVQHSHVTDPEVEQVGHDSGHDRWPDRTFQDLIAPISLVSEILFRH